jgi:hypothetical protein
LRDGGIWHGVFGLDFCNDTGGFLRHDMVALMFEGGPQYNMVRLERLYGLHKEQNTASENI